MITTERVLSPSAWQQNEGYLQQLLNHPWYRHIANINASILSSTHNFFLAQGIKPFVFPITTGSVSSPSGHGSDSLPVKIKLKRQEVFLADSMQFSLEVATRLNTCGAYYIMPTFRGEDVDARHLNEFIHSEVEIPGTLDDVMQLSEEYVLYVVYSLLRDCKRDIEATAGTMEHVEKLLKRGGRFPRVHFEDALNRLKDVQGATENIATDHLAITAIGEKKLLREIGDFVWLTNMPWSNVPFYQAKQENDPYSKTADLLAGIGEILGCGQRVKTVQELDESLCFHKVELHGYEWYAQMREQHAIQTAGFGMGIERLMLWATNTSDIRDCSLLYRDHNQIFFP